ncbi:MAG: hypothetical protein LBL50_00280, partial [Candidatus Margulisbacteria bacterium]|nr:hypothetical protein [Candidatus Margulisiibacteriota bacterium]
AQNMPSHNHGLTGLSVVSGGAHTHTASGLAVSTVDNHTHSFSATSSSNGSHNHAFPVTGANNNDHNGAEGNGAADVDAAFHDDSYTRDDGAHTHTVETSISGGGHTHTAGGDFSENGFHTHSIEGNAGASGGGVSFDVTPAYYTLIYIRKCE